ncbi:MAG: ATP-dependent RNA helicase HrpA, partial [Gammaproteobacteria bacterium]|nr:ATP-dependent RNA helicase HrpA [Gammaproteobacteria bacterium]
MRDESLLTLNFPDLPVTDALPELEAAIRSHQVIIVVGETGSGKTTQLPKLCLKLGRGDEKQIVHTQPRRLAARSVAARISEELQSDLGDLCGYQVRFDRQSSDGTPIKLVTDGLLLAEFRNDPLLESYDTVIVDEAHERSLNIDFLLGILKTILPKRPDLKVIVTSATINYEKFSTHFLNAPVIQVSGRTYPVDVLYHPMRNLDLSKADGVGLAQAIHQAVVNLRSIDRELRKPMGDILVFLPGEREIRDVSHFLRQAAVDRLDVLPLYARLGAKEQQRIFNPPNQGLQRIVLATNVAETSLTVPGIRYVIDSGLARISRYSPRSRIQRLPIEPISQASANQRSGRCGRTEPGIAIRLYDEDDFNTRTEFTDAEIVRTNLASVVLQCLDLSLGDPLEFPFVDPPEPQLIRDGIQQLRELDLVTPKVHLTKLGRRVANIPLDPRIGRILLDAESRHVFWEVSIVAAALSIQDPREQTFDDSLISDGKSQFVSLLNLWNYVEKARDELSNAKFRQWCISERLNYNRLREWREIHRQILLSFRNRKRSSEVYELDREGFHIALLTGFSSQIGRRDEIDYQGIRNRRFRVPKTALASKTTWVMAGELVETHWIIARTVAQIEPKWVIAAVPRLLKYTYQEPFWSKKQGRALCYRSTRLFGLTLL